MADAAGLGVAVGDAAGLGVGPASVHSGKLKWPTAVRHRVRLDFG